MKQVLLFAAVAAVLLGLLVADSAAAVERPLSRQRRRIDQLGHMISATTGHHYAAYIGYGNYCGPGGSGIPVDNIDTCCQSHDLCYASTKKMKLEDKCGPKEGPTFNPYLSKFSYNDLGSGRLECTDDRSSDYSNCLYQLCMCDKVFADCLQPIKDEYNKQHLKESQKYLRSLVLLVETAPSVSEWVWRIIESLLA